MAKRDNDKVLEEARDRFNAAVDYENENRVLMLEDQRFEAGDQWPDRIKEFRERDPYGPRPCLVLNRVSKHRRNIVNDIRQNRPQIKVLPVDDNADIETADMMNGLIRHIQVVSDADIAYDQAVDHQVLVGVGYFRVITRRVNELANLQEIAIRPVSSWASVYMDFYAEDPAGADAEWTFVIDEVPRKLFKKLYPKAELVDWKEAVGDSSIARWYPEEDSIRVAEYWTAEEKTVDMVMTELGDFTAEDYLSQFADTEAKPAVFGQRSDRSRVVTWRKMIGNDVLEERPYPSRFIGIVRVLGEERLIAGKRDIRGLIRDLKDAQRMYNYWASLNTELIALAPKTPWFGPTEAFEGHEDAWAAANNANVPYLQYNHLDSQGNALPPPSRATPISQNTALIQAMVQAADDLREISGQSESTFGEQGNEKSGRAIMARQRESDINNFHYVDNLTRSIRHAGRIVLDLIPHIYDTERVVRILGEDDSPDFAQLAPEGPAFAELEDAAGGMQRIYNPTVGRYDVTVSAGPSYATKRQEAFDAMSQVLQSNPELWAIMGDLLVRSMDWPGAEEMAERLKAVLPPEVQQIVQAKEEGKQGAQAQFEMAQQAVMQQVQPIIAELQAALEQAGQDVAQKDEALKKAELALANKAAELELKAKEIQLKHEADIADSDAEIVTAALQAKTQCDATAAQTQMARAPKPEPRQEPPLRQSDYPEIAAALGKLAEVSEMIGQGQAGVSEGLANLQAQIETAEQRRTEIQQAALDYLTTTGPSH